VKYVTECKKYRYGGVIARKFFLYAFDLIELNGDDLRPDPLEGRKATLEMILAKAGPGIRFNEHMEDGVADERLILLAARWR
jgi:ATP-dependent DNA ligase